MRKKIILMFSVMLLSIIMFGCSNNDIKTPKNLELKDEYKKDVSEMYPEHFKQVTLYLIDSYKNIETLSVEDLKKYGDLSEELKEGRDGDALTQTEKLLLKKAVAVQGDLTMYVIDGKKEETKTQLKTNMQTLLDLYK